MTEKLQISDIDFRVEQFSPENDLLKQYFQLRYDVYNSYNMYYYAKPTSTRWDRHPDSRFLILVNKKTGKVVGGRRFIIHQPDSETGIYSEENTGFQIEEMLPHIPANDMRFAELGSLCFAPELRGTGASEEMYRRTFEYMREVEVDFIVSNPVTSNYERLRTAALANGIKQFVRRDDLLSFEDGDDEPTVFMSFKTEAELPLNSPTEAKKFRNGIATNERQLLQKIFETSFVNCVNGKTLNKRFFSKKLTLKNLKIAHDFLQSRTANFNGVEIEAAHRINTSNHPDDEQAFMLLVQLHGNEPSGLAAFLYALALRQAGLLKKPVLAVIGNPLAAKQYFAHYAEHPKSPQEDRDAFRRGVDENAELLADMNRIPTNFRQLNPEAAHYVKRWQELDFMSENVTGILDIHSARGDMVCVTDSSDNSLLLNTNIRNILVGLTEAIGTATASETFKTVAGKKPNIKYQFGIEAGTHEDPKSFQHASEFTAAFFSNIGISDASPLMKNDNGTFYEYQVMPKLSFADLVPTEPIVETDIFITVKETENNLLPYQYKEMQKIKAGEILALSTTSTTRLSAPFSFSTLFITKSAEVYSDPAIGLYPVPAHKMDTKFCYPCVVKKIKIGKKSHVV